MNGPEQRFQFTGRGGELFVLLLVNSLLTSITFGVYGCWAYVRSRKYFLHRTELQGVGFEYHATGKELFLLAVYAGLAFGGLALVIGGLAYLFLLVLQVVWLLAIPAVLLLAALLGFVPWILVTWRRFQLRRSSYRDIRFDFTGSPGRLLKHLLIGGFLSSITLGIYGPWFQVRLQRFFRGFTRYGNQYFAYDGQGGKLFGIFLGGYLLTLITAGIYGPWWIAKLTRYHWEHTLLLGNRFHSDIRGGQIFGRTVLAILMTTFSAGIALPWAVVLLRRLFTDTVVLEGRLDFDAIVDGTQAEIGQELPPSGTEQASPGTSDPAPAPVPAEAPLASSPDPAKGPSSDDSPANPAPVVETVPEPERSTRLPSLPPQPEKPADWL